MTEQIKKPTEESGTADNIAELTVNELEQAAGGIIAVTEQKVSKFNEVVDKFNIAGLSKY